MELETFDDVCKSIEKNSDRNFHLLLGNGFSIAYDEAGRRRAARENIAIAGGRALNFSASHAELSSPLYKPSPYNKGDD